MQNHLAIDSRFRAPTNNKYADNAGDETTKVVHEMIIIILIFGESIKIMAVATNQPCRISFGECDW